MRLNKYIAACGICSRREADRLISEGSVLLNQMQAVNGQDVREGDLVTVNGKEIREEKKTVLAYYKPVGVTCSEKDEHAEKLITDMVQYPIRLTYAGRLDKDSEGLMLLTNDGDLIEKMMRGSNYHEKEYLVQVEDKVTEEFIRKMSVGLYLPDLSQKTRPCKVKQVKNDTFSIVLTQGLNRQIRKMCGQLHYHVVSLKRVRIMNICLDTLKPNEWRELTEEEQRELYRMCNR
jgi:23S rRNA pseudouridine2604 synthase